MELPDLDETKTAAKLESFLTDKLNQSGLKGFVVGLSGGIDS